MEKYICIHGHFYQPPRENAWLEVIEQQDSAYPYHDWNERITHECYGPNGASRILDSDKHITDIRNNYARMSFNFGPTLLQWMQLHAPEAYRNVIDSDALSLRLFDGHGSALAQVYNHIIMPLANLRDKETQVRWGIADFESRFGRKPEGMWLAETAVDTETLEVLAENEIRFTILAPRQAARIRKIGSNDWQSVDGESINTRKPYRCQLPSGKSILLFFYDGSISQDIAFKGLLDSGKELAHRLTSGFLDSDEGPQLVHVATDGESYGHHHRHGDMALAWCFQYLEQQQLAKPANYSLFLSKCPPVHEVEIHENSSWSCVHGVERWRSDCGCHSGGNLGWTQQWRNPLRKALDELRDALAPVYEREMKIFHPDPWALRNAYIEVVLDRNDESVQQFIDRHVGIPLAGAQKTRFIRLLEMQRHALLMYTSCGWFFDEISGIETTQILQYADRAIQLVESETEVRLEKMFLSRLREAQSNVPELGDGAAVHRKYVQPSRLTLSKVGSHYAVASLFEEFPESLTICNYKAVSDHYERIEAGSLRLAIGRTHVFSNITYSERRFYFAVIWLGQNHIIGNSSPHMEADEYLQMHSELTEAFRHSDVSKVIGIMQTYFGPEKFSLWNLFKDEQRRVLNEIVMRDVQQAEDSFRRIYNRNYNLMSVMSEARLPIPQVLVKNLENVINADIRHFFENGSLYANRLEKLAADALTWNVELDRTTIGFAAAVRLQQLLQQVEPRDTDIRLLELMLRIFEVLQQLEIQPDLWELQNLYFLRGKAWLEDHSALQFREQRSKLEWLKKYLQLGIHVNVKLPARMEEWIVSIN
jgi:alpha-amylase/alpha-mannosidase (GH57 family)